MILFQNADDGMFFLDDYEDNIWSSFFGLHLCFEEMSGLKFSLQKSNLLGIRVKVETVNHFLSRLALWKWRMSSLGGSYTLTKPELNALLTYAICYRNSLSFAELCYLLSKFFEEYWKG